jgi:hypothetical protein
MRKAIGFVIVLWVVTHIFGEATRSFEQAAVAGFETFEAAAELSQERLLEI